MPRTQPFTIATEGPTIDGRVLSRQQISDMAANYDPKVYTAVLNLEHLLSFAPDSLFSAYGKVEALSTKEANIMGEKRLQLLAVADVSEQAAKFQKEGKKAFASIEIMPNFTGKGISYLTGLALTDSPASVGTESMKFSAFNKGEKFAFPGEVAFALEAPPKSTEDAGESLFEKIKALLSKNDAGNRFADQFKAIETLADALSRTQADLAALTAQLKQHDSAIELRVKESAALTGKFTELEKALAAAPETGGGRPAATGGNGAAETDC
ncbi:MAG: GPO family capsid scaffolding protein [Candidatus Accumulibacter sp.]|jgi:hypothetical protein|nr:GPO family capsid scaffolding protein [Accumulibacter sp.]